MRIGERVKEVLFQRGRSAKWLADQLPCERTNVYNIFKRDDIGVKLLARIGIILGHDFFHDMTCDVAAHPEDYRE